MTELHQRLKAIRIVPVIAINNADDAVPLAKTLVDNGLRCDWRWGGFYC